MLVHRLDLVRASVPNTLMYDWAAGAEAHRKAWCGFLRVFTTLAKKRTLNGAEARRLDNLADLIATLGYAETTVGELELAWGGASEGLRALTEMCVLLAGIEASAVAAEAEIALTMEAESQDSEVLLFCGAKKRSIDGWGRVADQGSAVDVLVRLLGSTRWIAQIAAEALSSCPLPQRLVVGVDEKFQTWEAFNRLVAGDLLMRRDPSWRERAHLWKALEDPIARRVSAEALANDTGTPIEDVLSWFLNDQDAWVRTAAIQALSTSRPLNELAIVRIREIVATTPPSWLCIWCDKTSEAGTTSCSHCHVNGPDFLSSAGKLLRAHAP